MKKGIFTVAMADTSCCTFRIAACLVWKGTSVVAAGCYIYILAMWKKLDFPI
jgi:hypothetical protein